jgi:hypothetical protein
MWGEDVWSEEMFDRAQSFDMAQSNVWVTAMGEHIPYKNLDDSHLVNIIKMLQRKGHQGTTQYNSLLKIAVKRKLMDKDGEVIMAEIKAGQTLTIRFNKNGVATFESHATDEEAVESARVDAAKTDEPVFIYRAIKKVVPEAKPTRVVDL